MRVVPKKTERRTNKRAAKNSQLANAWNILDVQITGPPRVAADVRQHGQSARRDHRAADRQTVETVRQVHRVRGTCYDNHHKKKERQERERPQMSAGDQGMDHQVRLKFLEEWHNQLRGIRAVRG